MRGRTRILVVEDDRRVAHHLARRLSTIAPISVAHSVAEAAELLSDKGEWAGFIIDVGLPDGSGLDVLARATKLFPDAGRLVLTGHVERTLINEVAAHGAVFAAKPAMPEVLLAFAERCLEARLKSLPVLPTRHLEATSTTRLTGVIGLEALRVGLTRKEEDVVLRRLLGAGSLALQRSLGITRKTYEKHVSRILSKTGDRSMESLLVRLFRTAMDCERCATFERPEEPPEDPGSVH